MNLPFDKIDSLTDDQKRALLKLIAEHGTEYHIYPVSLEQKSIWFLYKRDEGKQNLYYNIRFQVKIRGNVSREQITAALQAVADQILGKIFCVRRICISIHHRRCGNLHLIGYRFHGRRV